MRAHYITSRQADFSGLDLLFAVLAFATLKP